MYPATLIKLLQSRKIVPFVGAGVSRAVTKRDTATPLFPSWIELLTLAAQRLDQENKPIYGTLVRSLITIDKPDFLQAARHAKEALGPHWYTLLSDQLDHPRSAAADDSLALARRLWTLGSNLVVTTNYDRVLAWASDQQDDLHAWNIESPAEQAAMMRSGLSRPVVWHLHGMISDSAKLILTPDGYNQLYPSDATKAVYGAALHSLRSLLTSHSLLFVGFGFADPKFGMTLRAVHDVFAGANGPHYALIHKDHLDVAREARLLNVELIPFADYGQPLLKVIDELSQIVASSEPTVLGPMTVVAALDRSPIVPAPKSIDEPFDDTCDTPPPTGTWVGRTDELILLSDPNAKVIAITGIGGQGKSTLVAKYLEATTAQVDIVDWRDCKEQDNTLHTHLVRIIERLTGGRSRASDLSGERIESVVRLFLNLSQSVRGLFVFDNIDQYVDINTSQAARGMHDLIQGALKTPGSSRCIFTCRPKLRYDRPTFLQIELKGLSLAEARELLRARGVTVSDGDLEELHALLQGHPLWIGLIANQILSKRVKVPVLIARIKDGKAEGLPTAMLQEVWRTLVPKQQKLLRYLAELVRPETEKHIQEVVDCEFSRNQFRSTLGRLKTLDLVVVKTPHTGSDTIELHPLVREFIRQRFSNNERDRYITAIMVWLDRIIVKLRPSLQRTATFDTLHKWTDKVELLINSRDYRRGLVVLDEASEALLSSGFSEDFVRVACGVLAICDWNDSATIESPTFENTYARLIEVLSQLGRFDDAEAQLIQFSKTAGGATARYVCICRLRAYFYWSRQEMELAKEWGQRGVDLKSSGNIDTRHDCAHDLALAQRDSGETERALKYFLHGADLNDVVNPSLIDTSRHGHFYGNIGRTLFFMSKDDDALHCLLKSAWLLEYESQAVCMNLGWISYWLGELLERKQEPTAAYICFRRAVAKWRNTSPFRASDALDASTRLADRVDRLSEADDAQIEHKYRVWLHKAKQF